MGKSFNRATQSLFDAGMKRIGCFAPSKPPKPAGWPGERAYCWTRDGRAVWICLLPHHRGNNEFTVEFGWSLLGRYPQVTSRPSRFSFQSEDLAECQEGFVRLRPERGASEPDWWSIAEGHGNPMAAARLACASLDEEQATRAATPLVDDALSCVERVGRALAEAVFSFDRP